MAFYPQWTTMPSPTLETLSASIVNASPSVKSFIARETHRVNVKYPRALLKAQDSDINLDNGDAQASSTVSEATTNWFASSLHTSLTNCDSGSLFCAVGTCYSGVNGYIGCCTVSSCAARTTCIPYHASQKSCNEDTEGCVFCSNPAMPYCYHFENWDAIPTEFAMWCTNSPSATIVFYSNPISYQYVADLPSMIFTPSWPTTLESSGLLVTSSGASSMNLAAATTEAGFTSDGGSSSNNISSYSGTNLSTGGMIGVAIGGAVALTLISALIAFLLWKKTNKRSIEQDPMLQHSGTSGGAVLPGTWFGGNGNANQNSVRETPASADSVRLVQQPEVSSNISTNQELEDTTIPAYSIELGSTDVRPPNIAPSSQYHQAMGARPTFTPYSPMGIVPPGSIYANRQASVSDPVLGNHQGDQGPKGVDRDLDGNSWMQSNHNQGDTQNTTHPVRTSYNTENIGGHQLPLRQSSLIRASGLISPVSTSTSPYSPSSQQIQPMINQSTSLSSHPSHHGFVLPPQQVPATAIPARSTSLQPAENLTPLSNPIAAKVGLSSDHADSGQTQAVSARGSWSTWISPEVAYAEGLWEGRSNGDERQEKGAGLELNEKEKKD